MVRSDRSTRGGTAARLLAAEKELSCITASAAETRGAPNHQAGFAQGRASNPTQPKQLPAQPHRGSMNHTWSPDKRGRLMD